MSRTYMNENMQLHSLDLTNIDAIKLPCQDYALWDVIENENSFKPTAQTTTNADGTSTLLIPGPVTTKEKVQKKNDVKARSMLLMTLPNEHLMTFNRTRASEDCKSAGYLRNKPDLDTMSFDDLYNNFKIVEQEVKGTASSSSQNMAFVSSPSNTNEVNTAYGVSVANTQVSPASTQVSTTSTQVSTANLSDDTVYAFLASQPNRSQLVYEDLEQIHEDDIEEMDLKWQLALSMRTRRESRGPRTKKAGTAVKTASKRAISVKKLLPKPGGIEELVLTGPIGRLKKSYTHGTSFSDSEKKGVGFVSYNVVPPPPTWLFSPPKFDLSNSGLEEFQQPEFEGYGPKTSKSVSEDTSNEVRESPNAPLVEELVSDDKHMTGNMSYLSDFKEFDGGYVTFGGGAKGGKITSKGTLKTGKLDFEDVYFVKELQFNLFSVSEMCETKTERVTLMPPKRTSTSETPAITLAAIQQLINDGISSALKAQAASMASDSNPNRNTGPTGTPVAKNGKLQKNSVSFNLIHQWYRRKQLPHSLIDWTNQYFLIAIAEKTK
ncbi:hypothetical protein Tco_0600673 [Tanacetum coccineum]